MGNKNWGINSKQVVAPSALTSFASSPLQPLLQNPRKEVLILRGERGERIVIHIKRYELLKSVREFMAKSAVSDITSCASDTLGHWEMEDVFLQRLFT